MRYTIITVVGIHLLLFIFEGLPFFYLLVGIIMNLIFLRMLPRFPNIAITDIYFLVNCVLLIVDHGIWFKYFAEIFVPVDEVLTFFLINVWLIPFLFFVGLTTSDDTLPYGATVNSSDEPIGKKSKKSSKIVSILQSIQQKGKKLLKLEEDYKSF